MARDTGNRLNENDEYTYKPAQVRSSCLPLAVRIFSFFFIVSTLDKYLSRLHFITEYHTRSSFN